MMTNLEMARRFEQIADILEISGENPFKVRAYRAAAETILDLDEPLAQIEARGGLKELPGFGEAIVAKTRDFLATGTTALWERVKDTVPPGVVRLASVPGIGPKTAKALWEALQVDGIDALERACQEGRVRAVAGFGPAKETALLEKIAAWRRLSARLPRGRALPLAESLAAGLRRLPGVQRVEIAGELRRGCDEVCEIVLVVAAEEGAVRASAVDGSGPEIPVRLVECTPDAFDAEWFRQIGPERFVASAGPPDAVCASIPWELRDWPDAIELAAAGRLPKLIEEADFRGQLHEHTLWSDGTASIRAMAEAALARGYAYLAITDHSPLVAVANGLTRDRLLQQLDEVAACNAEFIPRGLTLLTGLEVDIREDGSLDMDDETLAQLDVVVASVHRRYREDEAAMTRRLTTALASPHVDILGHPTGRLLGRREPYPVDIDAVIDAAVRYGKILEINASPERMDLKDAYARRAKAAGAKLSVNADAHSAAGLGNLSWGLCMARRAGLEAEDVVNTWPLARLRASLKRA